MLLVAKNILITKRCLPMHASSITTLLLVVQAGPWV
jgi:hypothetical protein